MAATPVVAVAPVAAAAAVGCKIVWGMRRHGVRIDGLVVVTQGDDERTVAHGHAAQGQAGHGLAGIGFVERPEGLVAEEFIAQHAGNEAGDLPGLGNAQTGHGKIEQLGRAQVEGALPGIVGGDAGHLGGPAGGALPRQRLELHLQVEKEPRVIGLHAHDGVLQPHAGQVAKHAAFERKRGSQLAGDLRPREAQLTPGSLCRCGGTGHQQAERGQGKGGQAMRSGQKKRHTGIAGDG